MSEFIQLHLLTSYPPSNLNRDDTGRPKTAMFGTSQRLRISSQSLKRAFRTSEIFLRELGANEGFNKAQGQQIGIRTKDIGEKLILEEFRKRGFDTTVASEIASKAEKALVEKPKNDKSVKQAKTAKASSKQGGTSAQDEGNNNEQGTQADAKKTDKKALYFVSLGEKARIDDLINRVAQGHSPTEADYASLRTEGHHTPDIALFGRMIAQQPARNVEAACQVAHALSVHKVTVEEDFFSAVDDLNQGDEDVGAGHLGTTEFGAALFYLYICIDRSLLEQNLGGDKKLTEKTLRAILKAACQVSPGGKQNTFASRERAHFVLAEVGDQQPRSLSVSFLHPLEGKTLHTDSINRLLHVRDAMDRAYGDCSRDHRIFQPFDLSEPKMDAKPGQPDSTKATKARKSAHTFEELLTFVTQAPEAR